MVNFKRNNFLDFLSSNQLSKVCGSLIFLILLAISFFCCIIEMLKMKSHCAKCWIPSSTSAFCLWNNCRSIKVLEVRILLVTQHKRPAGFYHMRWHTLCSLWATNNNRQHSKAYKHDVSVNKMHHYSKTVAREFAFISDAAD